MKGSPEQPSRRKALEILGGAALGAAISSEALGKPHPDIPKKEKTPPDPAVIEQGIIEVMENIDKRAGEFLVELSSVLAKNPPIGETLPAPVAIVFDRYLDWFTDTMQLTGGRRESALDAYALKRAMNKIEIRGPRDVEVLKVLDSAQDKMLLDAATEVILLRKGTSSPGGFLMDGEPA